MLRAAVAVWILFGIVCAASVYGSMLDHGHSPAWIAVYEVLVWIAWAPATLLVAALGRRRPVLPFRARAAALHLGAALALGVLHVAWWKTLLVLMRPFDHMGPQSFAAVDLDISDPMFLEVTIYTAVLGVTVAFDQHRRVREREAALAQARLTALELQLRPHFLFNTLHAIGGLVRQGRGTDAVEMIAGLSELLRYSLDHAGKTLVALEREVEITARYLEIQRQRFSDRLTTTIDVPAELGRARVPALVLQPLLENAVRHGIERASGAGTITVAARRDGARLVIEVVNTGPPLAGAPAGVGIDNTRARLAQLFGGDASLALTDGDGVVVATITLPLEEPRR